MKQGTIDSNKPTIVIAPRFFSSLANQLRYAPVVHVVSTMLVLVFIFMSHSFGIQKQAVAVLQQDYGAFVATAVDDHIQRQYEDLQSLAHVISLGLLSADEQVIMLANIPQHYDVGESVMLVVEDGAGVTAVYPQNTLLLDASVQQMQQAVTDSATGIAFIPDISSPDAYALVMGAPLLRPDDSPYGMVLWRTDLAFLQGILDSSGVKYDGYA
ncbi:MAG: hypothetical protein KC443_20080, partial [Anaerolineales bacterium]|nr:hypothetical protein [Anaerolineales bacterium]